MIKCGTSHSLLGALVLVFSDELKLVALNVLTDIPNHAYTWLESLISMPMSKVNFSYLIIVGFCFSWGVLYHHFLSIKRQRNE